MDKNTILNYVVKTPYNTNPNVIGNMIDALVEGEAPTGNIKIIENGENINVAQYATATVAVPAEVSSLSTCTMTLTSNNDITWFYCPLVSTDKAIGTDSISSGTYNVILYEGKGRILIHGSPSSVTITGDAEQQES